MATQDFKRKLTAILSADAKGYSRLMAENEEATVRTITAFREIVTEVVQKHRGRVVDSPGDNILAEFASAVDAVRGGVEIQEELKARNAELPENRRMEFRIGINLGDVIHEEERIYGDGVNIAARVEGLAEGGGICISGTVYEHIKNKLALGYQYLGEHSVKNIPEPVRVYRVLMDPEAIGKVIGEKRVVPRRGQRVVIAVAIVFLLAVGGVIYWRAASPPVEVASVEKMAFPLPDKPSIAVLPFDNMSNDPKQEYFSDGITEDLITDLSKISGLFVIARNSTFTYKGKAVKVQQVAEELGVRYVLEGSVRKERETVRINAQLVDATTGHHLWAERFDGTFADIFALQDRFTRKIVAALALKLTGDEQRKLTFRYTDNVEAYDAYLKGREHFLAGTPEDYVKAVGYYEKAVELDPDFSPAHAGLASVYTTILSRNLTKELGWPDARSRVQKHLQMAMKNPTPNAHYAVGKTRLYQRRYDEAIAEAERVIALDPNFPDGYYLMGLIFTFAGRSAEAIDYFKRAMRLDPQYPGGCLYYLGLAQYCLEQYEEAATSVERSQKLNPGYGPWPLAITYAQLGRGQEAADILAKYFEKRGWLLALIENTFPYWPFKEQKDLDHWAEGLRKSGLMRPWNPVYRREYDKAIADAEQAIALNPNDAKAQYAMGETLVFSGRSAEAVEYLEKAMSLDPEYPGYYLYTLGVAQFCLERYEEAASDLEIALYKRKMHALPPMWLLAATYAHLGRQQEAEDVLTKYLKERGYEGYTVERVLKYYLHAFKDPKDTKRFAQGLHKAGLPM
ncbi:MAG: tetratricopeptide repeat protein [Deltaproteobacteria bacterium]|nr:tetratricopeptide repeat protein [Deltaproteobacteria bacterium]MDH3929502.1 tetratricopeptide repeat protein [Deltaproteobacteria bacterium]